MYWGPHIAEWLTSGKRDKDFYSYLLHSPWQSELPGTWEVSSWTIHAWEQGPNRTVWALAVTSRTKKLHWDEVFYSTGQNDTCQPCPQVRIPVITLYTPDKAAFDETSFFLHSKEIFIRVIRRKWILFSVKGKNSMNGEHQSRAM